jgi:hypothetical protein
MTAEWRAFKDDAPGERFKHHYQRMRQTGTRAGAIARLGLGILLVLAGIVMLFVPGPGILVALFGLGLLGGESKWLASKLDRVEPAMRQGGKQVKRWWLALSRPAKAVLAAAAGLAVGFVIVTAIRWVF